MDTSPKHLTRTGIMLALLPLVTEGLKAIKGLDLATPEGLRRTIRALAHLSIKMALDAGVPPEVVAGMLSEALHNEVVERQGVKEAEGAAQVADAKEAGGAAILSFPKQTKGGVLPN